MFSQRPTYYSTQCKLSEGRSKGAESEAKMNSKITVHACPKQYVHTIPSKQTNLIPAINESK